MREVVFRGKPKDETQYYFFSQIWKDNCVDGFTCGSLVVDKGRCFIAVSALCSIKSCINNGMTSMIEVIPETVGQYTGLTDKNGKEIFEGDIVIVDLILNPKKYVGVVVYNKDCFGVDIKGITPVQNCLAYSKENGEIEVVGNIYDNPELLKGGEDND